MNKARADTISKFTYRDVICRIVNQIDSIQNLKWIYKVAEKLLLKGEAK